MKSCTIFAVQANGRALRTVDDCLDMIEEAKRGGEDVTVLGFYRERLAAMQRFFRALDRVVGTILTVENLREATLGKPSPSRKAPRERTKRSS